MSFRHDINALRALAVIIVVLFHFNETTLPGGFIGVDIFFVLSGFLMTGIIFSDLNSDFSLFGFFKSRARRILPPLMALCLFLLALGWFYLPPHTYMMLGKHSLASLIFSSNIIYWLESGYFDSSSHGKFLLHTWSLSVEWQFYILYPIILKTLSKILNLQQLKYAVITLFILSFVFCLSESTDKPAAAFFLFGARAWELLFGGILFLFPLKLPNKIRAACSSAGLCIIISSSLFITSHMLWPLPWAGFPVIGTGLIIIANQQHSFLTSNTLITYLGKSSYSIYLWHWPVTVCFYYLNLLNSISFIILGILISILLGSLSYQLIEKRAVFNIKATIGLALLLATSAVIFFNQGLPSRFKDDEKGIFQTAKASPKRLQCHSKKWKPKLAKHACKYPDGVAHWAVLGDSHGVELAYALSRLLKPGISVQHFTLSHCAPSYMSAEASSCTKWTNESIDAIKNNKDIKYVIISYRYSLYLAGELNQINELPENQEQVLASLKSTIVDLSNDKTHVFFILPVPEMNRSIHSLMNTEYLTSQSIPQNLVSMPLKQHTDRNQIILNWLNSQTFPKNVSLINPEKTMCDANNCYAIKYSTSYYFDDDHLSIEGAKNILLSSPMFSGIVERIE